VVIQNFQNATIRTVTLGSTKPQANGDRFGLGLVMVEPPAESLSEGRTFLPPLPFPDQVSGRTDDGDPAKKRYPASPAPAGSVGSVPGSPVCRTVPTVRPSALTARTAAATVTLESKLDPLGRRRDCQSLLARADIHAELKANPSWPQATVQAATPASPK
jgi:hypothetical protein